MLSRDLDALPFLNHHFTRGGSGELVEFDFGKTVQAYEKKLRGRHLAHAPHGMLWEEWLQKIASFIEEADPTNNQKYGRFLIHLAANDVLAYKNLYPPSSPLKTLLGQYEALRKKRALTPSLKNLLRFKKWDDFRDQTQAAAEIALAEEDRAKAMRGSSFIKKGRPTIIELKSPEAAEYWSRVCKEGKSNRYGDRWCTADASTYNSYRNHSDLFIIIEDMDDWTNPDDKWQIAVSHEPNGQFDGKNYELQDTYRDDVDLDNWRWGAAFKQAVSSRYESEHFEDSPQEMEAEDYLSQYWNWDDDNSTMAALVDWGVVDPPLVDIDESSLEQLAQAISEEARDDHKKAVDPDDIEREFQWWIGEKEVYGRDMVDHMYGGIENFGGYFDSSEMVEFLYDTRKLHVRDFMGEAEAIAQSEYEEYNRLVDSIENIADAMHDAFLDNTADTNDFIRHARSSKVLKLENLIKNHRIRPDMVQSEWIQSVDKITRDLIEKENIAVWRRDLEDWLNTEVLSPLMTGDEVDYGHNPHAQQGMMPTEIPVDAVLALMSRDKNRLSKNHFVGTEPAKPEMLKRALQVPSSSGFVGGPRYNDSQTRGGERLPSDFTTRKEREKFGYYIDTRTIPGYLHMAYSFDLTGHNGKGPHSTDNRKVALSIVRDVKGLSMGMIIDVGSMEKYIDQIAHSIRSGKKFYPADQNKDSQKTLGFTDLLRRRM